MTLGVGYQFPIDSKLKIAIVLSASGQSGKLTQKDRNTSLQNLDYIPIQDIDYILIQELDYLNLNFQTNASKRTITMKNFIFSDIYAQIRYEFSRNYTAYLNAGFSYASFKVFVGDEKRTIIRNQNGIGENYSAAGMMFGIGSQYKISPNMAIFAEANFRNATINEDEFGKVYNFNFNSITNKSGIIGIRYFFN